MRSHSRGPLRPRFCMSFTPFNQEGAGNAGRRLAPAVSCAGCTQKCAHEHTGTAGAARHSLRDGFTAYTELSLETNSFCLHRRRIEGSSKPGWISQNLRRLDASNGRQNHTVLPYATAPFIVRDVNRSRVAPPCRHLPRRRLASTASRLAFVTIAIRPSCRGGTARK